MLLPSAISFAATRSIRLSLLLQPLVLSLPHTRMSTEGSTAPTQEQQGIGRPGGFFSKLRNQAEQALAKVPAYNELEHSLRQAGAAANPQNKHVKGIHLAVKGAKGVIIDHEAVSRESKSYSKNILDLVREENRAPGTDVADIQDVGDRLAFLTYKQGEVSDRIDSRLRHSRG